MKLSIMGFTALVMAALSTPAAAEGSHYWGKDHWDVYALDGSECALTATFEDQSILYVLYGPTNDTVRLAISDANMRSLRIGATYEMETVFIGGGDMDTGWGVKPFTAYTFDNGTPYLARDFDGKLMLDDIAKNDILGFGYEETVIKSYSLAGSAMAVRQLRACAFAQSGLNPNDPFAGLPHPDQPKDPFEGLPQPDLNET